MKPKQLIPALKVALANKYNCLIKGRPGIGKSEIVNQACKDLSYDLLLELACTSDPIDWKGMCCVVNGKADFIPFGSLRRMLETKTPLVVFFDDIGWASVAVQSAICNLILAREVNGQKISDEVRFVAATNNRKDGANVTSIMTPLLSRFALIAELEVDIDAWKQWALNAGLPIELIAFANFRPQLFTGKLIKKDAKGNDIFEDTPVTKEIENFACPRTIANLGRWLNSGITDVSVWEGCVGSAFAIEFASFYRTFKELAGLPEKCILDPNNAPIPENQATMFALVGALSHKSSEKNFDAILSYMSRLPTEFQVFYIKDSTVRNPKLLETNGFVKWSTVNPTVIQ